MAIILVLSSPPAAAVGYGCAVLNYTSFDGDDIIAAGGFDHTTMNFTHCAELCGIWDMPYAGT